MTKSTDLMSELAKVSVFTQTAAVCVVGFVVFGFVVLGDSPEAGPPVADAAAYARAADAKRNAAVRAAGGYIKTEECWKIADKAVRLSGGDPTGTVPAERQMRRSVFETCAEQLPFANKNASTVAGTRAIMDCMLSAPDLSTYKGCSKR